MNAFALGFVRNSRLLFALMPATSNCMRLVRLVILPLLGAASVQHAYAGSHHARTASRATHVAAKLAGHRYYQTPPPNRIGRPPARHAGQISPEVIQALRAADVRERADPFVLLAIAWKESRFDPLARNKHSSARGLLQFTAKTWLTAIRDFGGRHDLAHLAATIKTDRDGRLTVSSVQVRRRILALRDNPALEAIMAAEHLAQMRVALEARLDRPATPADLYMLHLLGPTGAVKFLTFLAEEPDSPSIEAVGAAAIPNWGLFIHHGRTLTVAQVYEDIGAALKEQAALHAGIFDADTSGQVATLLPGE